MHGTPGNAQSWADFLLSPIVGHEYLALDRPGFGMSVSEAITDLSGQAMAVSKLFPDDPRQKVILVGHSYGVGVAIRVLLDYPHRVSGALLSGSPLNPELETLLPGQRLIHRYRKFLPAAAANSNAELLEYRQELEKIKDHWPHIRHPLTFIHGTKDIEVPFANFTYIRERLVNHPSVRFITLEGYSHYLPWLATDTMTEALQELCGRIANGGV